MHLERVFGRLWSERKRESGWFDYVVGIELQCKEGMNCWMEDGFMARRVGARCICRRGPTAASGQAPGNGDGEARRLRGRGHQTRPSEATPRQDDLQAETSHGGADGRGERVTLARAAHARHRPCQTCRGAGGSPRENRTAREGPRAPSRVALRRGACQGPVGAGRGHEAIRPVETRFRPITALSFEHGQRGAHGTMARRCRGGASNTTEAGRMLDDRRRRAASWGSMSAASGQPASAASGQPVQPQASLCSHAKPPQPTPATGQPSAWPLLDANTREIASALPAPAVALPGPR